jgi:hypothetical protein
MQTVRRNRAVTDRIAADIDGVIGGFEPYAGPPVAPDAAMADAAVADLALAGPDGQPLNYPLSAPADGDDGSQDSSRPPWELDDGQQAEAAPSRPPWEDAVPDGIERDSADLSASVPPAPAGQLAEAFTGAAGVAAVVQAMATARGAQAARLTGWPAARLARRRPGPTLRGAGGPASRAAEAAGQAQQSEVDNAITAFADAVGGALPVPWAGSVRAAARSNAPLVPGALADAVRGVAAASSPRPPAWWRLVMLWQWLLTVLAAAAVVVAVVIAIDRLTGHHKGVMSEASLIPWLLALAVALLVLGFLTAVGCRNTTVAAAEREREEAERAMRTRVSDVTRDLVLVPTGAEITQYERFRRELAVASAVLSRSPPGVRSPVARGVDRKRARNRPSTRPRIGPGGHRPALYGPGGHKARTVAGPWPPGPIKLRARGPQGPIRRSGRRLVTPGPGIAERTARRTPSVRTSDFGSSF